MTCFACVIIIAAVAIIYIALRNIRAESNLAVKDKRLQKKPADNQIGDAKAK